MLPFLGTQELGKDGGSSRETRSSPDPPLACPLTPAERQERGFCPTSPSWASFPAPSSPLQPLHAEQLPCLAGEGLRTPGTPDPPREEPACPPLPGRAPSLCAAPARRDSSSASRSELPSPRSGGPEGEPGRMDPAPSPPVWVWITQRGAGWLTVRFKGCTEFAVQPVLRSQLPQAPVESQPSPCVLTQSRLRCNPILPSSPLLSRSAERGVPWERWQAGSG